MTADLPRRGCACLWGLLFAAMVTLGAVTRPAHAAEPSVEPFYRGRTVTLVVGTSPGGINDLSARIVARHIGRFIPGNPTVIVQDVPGGGGLVTANRIYNGAERDGSVLAKIERGVPQLAIEGNRNANFDPLKFTWLGSLSSYADDAYLLLVNDGYRAKTVADLRKPGKPTMLGADNAASSNLVFGLIAREVLGLNLNVIRGYAGAAPMFLAMQSNELDGQMIGLSSDQDRAARPLEPARISAADSVRAQHAPRGAGRSPDRARIGDGCRRPRADRVRRVAVLHGLAVRRAARPAGRARRGLARSLHGHVPRQNLHAGGRGARVRPQPDRRRRRGQADRALGGDAKAGHRPL